MSLDVWQVYQAPVPMRDAHAATRVAHAAACAACAAACTLARPTRRHSFRGAEPADTLGSAIEGPGCCGAQHGQLVFRKSTR